MRIEQKNRDALMGEIGIVPACVGLGGESARRLAGVLRGRREWRECLLTESLDTPMIRMTPEMFAKQSLEEQEMADEIELMKLRRPKVGYCPS